MKKGIGERIAEITEIPKDYIMNLPRITILGTREVYVDNYKGLLEYSHELIRLATTNKIIIIKGTGLIVLKSLLLIDTLTPSSVLLPILKSSIPRFAHMYKNRSI